MSAREFELSDPYSPVARLSFGLELYFPRPMRDFDAQILDIWQRFRSAISPQDFTWGRLGGGIRTRSMGEGGHRAVGRLLDGTQRYGLACFILASTGDFEVMGDVGFRLHGNNRLQNGADDTDVNYLSIRMPVRWIPDDAESLFALCCELAGRIDFIGGSAGYFMQLSAFSGHRLWAHQASLLQRFPGLEPDAPDNGAAKAPFGLTGVNWLTFIGADHLRRLGVEPPSSARPRNVTMSSRAGWEQVL